MSKLEKFSIQSKGSVNALDVSSMAKINGATVQPTQHCGSYEQTCVDYCTDGVWIHYTDGVETWRTSTMYTATCP